jgi:hypothetical protein
LVQAACAIARLVMIHVPAGELRLETLNVLRGTGGLSDEAARVLLSAVARAFLPCPPLESLVPSGPSL